MKNRQKISLVLTAILSLNIATYSIVNAKIKVKSKQGKQLVVTKLSQASKPLVTSKTSAEEKLVREMGITIMDINDARSKGKYFVHKPDDGWDITEKELKKIGIDPLANRLIDPDGSPVDLGHSYELSCSSSNVIIRNMIEAKKVPYIFTNKSEKYMMLTGSAYTNQGSINSIESGAPDFLTPIINNKKFCYDLVICEVYYDAKRKLFYIGDMQTKVFNNSTLKLNQSNNGKPFKYFALAGYVFTAKGE